MARQMSKIKWVRLSEWEQCGQGLVVVTELRLRRLGSTVRFLTETRRVEAQLREADRVIAYSLRAKPLQRTYWTLSLWPDKAALEQFLGGDPHRRIMTDLQPIMARVRTKSLEIVAEEIPETWEQAVQYLDPV